MKFKSERAVILGGILLGDTFRLNTWIQEVSNDQPLVAFTCEYNSGAVEVFEKDTNLPIVQNVVLKDFRMETYDWNDFLHFEEMWEKSEYRKQFRKVFFPTIDDIHHPLAPLNYKRPDFNIDLPNKFIAVQPMTHLPFKNLPEVFKVRYPLPVVNLGSKDDLQVILGSQVENGRPLREGVYILSKAKLVVGVDSVLSQVAAQIGVPAIKCHFGKWEANFRSIRELGGVDLYRPSVELLEKTISVALDLIEKGEKNLSELSRVPSKKEL